MMPTSKYIKRLILIVISLACASTALGKTISITVTVDKKLAKTTTILGLGFSANKKSHGGFGKRITRKGLADTRYTFGFRNFQGNVGCGSSVLTEDSLVVLYYKNSKCTHQVFLKKMHQHVHFSPESPMVELTNRSKNGIFSRPNLRNQE